jgi:hypothetical protein
MPPHLLFCVCGYAPNGRCLGTATNSAPSSSILPCALSFVYVVSQSVLPPSSHMFLPLYMG